MLASSLRCEQRWGKDAFWGVELYLLAFLDGKKIKIKKLWIILKTITFLLIFNNYFLY